MNNTNTFIDLIIKFGGSAITDKNTFETIKKEELLIAANCIRSCREAGLSCIVVHGAGSFGHHQAKRYQVNDGFVTATTKDELDFKRQGFCLTRQSVTKLNQLVVNCLIDVGVPAVACSPGSSWEVDKKLPVRWPDEIIAGLVEKGFVPVLHGDCCVDKTLGCCILSGDTIIKSLCNAFTTRRVVFLADVAGIYNRPPDQPGAQLLKSILVNSDGLIQESVCTSQSCNDVTGGIQLKLKTAIDIVVQSKGRCPVFVTSIKSPDMNEVCLGKDSINHWNATSITMHS
ncbi:unnamed protein product [Lymnaea stagnalis]|uniref:Isopentenyl phosphate kinase n=1 Tax=Lymnaea stagnalis TaxID=6523 RepID=A0AAV2H6M6_LYMST